MITRRRFLETGGTFAAASALAGCSRLEGLFFTEPLDPLSEPVEHFSPGGTEVDLVTHVLNRCSFGPLPGDYARICGMGETQEEAVEAYLEEQLAPSLLDDGLCETALRRLETLDEPVGELFEYQPKLLQKEISRAAILRAVLSKRQLLEVMVSFWSDHFNIDLSKGDCKWLKIADDRDVIRKHALGTFPELLHASAKSPAMLWYLDGRLNKKENETDRPNENYARELMELHTLGVHGGYTQQDIMEAARCLTGWTVRDGKYFGKARVVFDPSCHDDGEKRVLGRVIPAGGGEKDILRLIDIVAFHPSTADFLATKLCKRFVSDTPSERTVREVARSFRESRGDIRITLKTLFRTEEFRSARGTKFKRPFRFLVSSLRATAARTDAGDRVLDYLTRMGQAPFQFPTPDGYPDESLPWMGTLMWRWEFAAELMENRIPGTRVDPDRLAMILGPPRGIMAHFLGRLPTKLEQECFESSGHGVSLMLASPAFQRC